MRFVATSLCCALVAPALSSHAAEAVAQASRGQDLFVHKWVAHDPLCPDGDGLGPMHNATSCVACHDQGGIGGGGSRGANVDLLSLELGDNESWITEVLRERLAAVHPAFTAGGTKVKTTIVLHNFGPEADYGPFRAQFGRDPGSISQGWGGRNSSGQPVVQIRVVDGLRFQRSQRNTPALWGAGLIDEITADDLEALAADQQKKKKKTGVTGRVPHADDGGVGRFGWRGQTATLQQFVLGACANELGLQTKGQPQAMNPLSPQYAPRGIDLSEEHCQALVAFVSDLPRPVEEQPASVELAETVDRGEKLFENVGCTVCHPRQVGTIDGLFSDLLLHDMGEALADAAEPNPPKRREIRRQTPSGPRMMYIEVAHGSREMRSEWRTPPLWGVRDSAPYLHDGRAATLDDAIKLHGGEAMRAAKKYTHLSEKQRGDLVAFLQTLVAPPDAPRMPGKKK